MRKDTRANLAQVTRDVLALCETLHASTLKYRKMVASLNTAAENLRSSLLQVELASRQVANASSEIAASSQSVA